MAYANEICRLSRTIFVQQDSITKNNPRDLCSTVNRLFGESKEPATTDLTTGSFQAFFNKKVEDICSDTADAPSPMYAQSLGCTFAEFDVISVEKRLNSFRKHP